MPAISGPYLQILDAQVRTDYNKFFETAPSLYKDYALVVPSTSRENFFPRLDEIPGLREWVGDRVIHQLGTGGFAIQNKTFEGTISIKREDIEDDQFGIFQIGIQQLGKNAGVLPDLLCSRLLASGTTTTCYDGQYFFDTDHESYDADGKPVSYSNSEGPAAGETAGPAWYALDTTQALRAVIFQRRRDFTITAKTALDDDNVFKRNEYVWGTDGRCNVGFGMYQVAYRSTRPLTIASWASAVAKMGSQRRVDGAPYAISPNRLMVPKALEGDARALASNKLIAVLQANGSYATQNNQWVGTFEPIINPWL
ncbi:MAG: Mu-like prophage major head subunit gpT family protein [Gluconacetobacter sp.]